MIHITRPDPQFSPSIRDIVSAHQYELEMEIEKAKNLQRRVSFNTKIFDQFRIAATQAFNSKCAFCESPVGISSHPQIHHFYPKSIYPILAYSWQNIYLACAICNANLGPFDPGPPDHAPRILDPCRDLPEESLTFDKMGHALALNIRGQTTIEVLSLNREFLVRARKEAVRNALNQLIANKYKVLPEDLPAARVPYCAAIRAVFKSEGLSRGKTRSTPIISLTPIPAGDIATPHLIDEIEIKGFKLASDIQLKLKPFDQKQNQCSWLALIGENGTGKSTILQAIALALMGEEGTNHWPKDALTKDTREGSIKIKFHNRQPLKVFFDADGPRFIDSLSGANTLIRAFGPNHDPASNFDRPEASPVPPRSISNLFRMAEGLLDIEAWMAKLEQDSNEFMVLSLGTKDFLNLPDALLKSSSGRLLLNIGGRGTHFSDVSTGFQSILSIFGELVALASSIGQADAAEAPGIVLIDELGNHLHPRWKMTIVSGLRRAFPKMQFIISTHDPLCLRGLGKDEVALLELNENKRTKVVSDLPDPSAMRVDQLLTSRFFGLHSTIEPEIDKSFERYYELLRSSSRSVEEANELSRLTSLAARHSVLGFTRRDQLVYELIDEYLAQKNPRRLDSIPENVKRRVFEIWSWVNSKISDTYDKD